MDGGLSMEATEATPFVYDPAIHEITDDGYAINKSDGEIVGCVGGYWDGNKAAPFCYGETLPFSIECHADADELLERIANHEAAVLAIEARRAAMNANLDSQLVDHKSRLAYLERFQVPQAIEWAKRNRPSKGKTIKLDNGQICIRATQPTIEITDEAKALELVKGYAPDMVKVKESVSVEAVKAAMAAKKALYGPGYVFEGITEQAAGEKITLRTGIGKGGK